MQPYAQPQPHTHPSVASPLRPRIHTFSPPFNASSLPPLPLPRSLPAAACFPAARPPAAAWRPHGASAPARMQFFSQRFRAAQCLPLLSVPAHAPLCLCSLPVTYTLAQLGTGWGTYVGQDYPALSAAAPLCLLPSAAAAAASPLPPLPIASAVAAGTAALLSLLLPPPLLPSSMPARRQPSTTHSG